MNAQSLAGIQLDLLGSRFAPITESIGFVEGDAPDVAEAIAAGASGFWAASRVEPLDGSLEEGIARLSPMGDFSPSRYLVLSTPTRWTAVFNNALHPSVDEFGRLAQRVGLPAAYFSHVPDMHRLPGGRYGFTQFAIFSNERSGEAADGPVRLVFVINDGGRWEFSAIGAAQPYESLERYGAKRLRDRLMPEMLVAYGRALGIDIDDEDFYRGPAYLVSESGGRKWEFVARFIHGPTLGATRRRFGLDT